MDTFERLSNDDGRRVYSFRLANNRLGASYSQLPRKIIIVHPPEGPVPTLLSADDSSQVVSLTNIDEYERTDSPAFSDALENFLRYLGFWQDVLAHCSSTRIRLSLLETFKALFLRQLLYPSLLESSEGDSVAILTYLRIILEVLEHEDLGHVMLSVYGRHKRASNCLKKEKPSSCEYKEFTSELCHRTIA